MRTRTDYRTEHISRTQLPKPVGEDCSVCSERGSVYWYMINQGLRLRVQWVCRQCGSYKIIGYLKASPQLAS